MDLPRTRLAVPTLFAGAALAAFLTGCGGGTDEAATETETASAPASEAPGDSGFGEMPIPADNPQTPQKIALGHQLYFDTRLSVDGSRSCYSCHVCENGLTDGRATAMGAAERALTRSSPSLWNIGYQSEFYWDGRSGTMEAQAKAAWTGGNMGADADAVVATLNGIEAYREQFQAVFGEDATPDNVVAAIASYERDALICDNTAYDRWQRGDQSAVSDAAKRGAELFVGKAGCGNCHAGILLTDMKYHNVGIGMDAAEPDLGRFRKTEAEADRGAFKTPSLRDISKSAPYMHNGSVATLEEAVNLMASGGIDNPHLDRENMQDRGLTDAEKADIVAFLKSLDCNCSLSAPELPQ